MQIRMYEHKAAMDAGRERTFAPGEVYTVSPVIGAQWVRDGVAVEEPSPRHTPVTAKRKGEKG